MFSPRLGLQWACKFGARSYAGRVRVRQGAGGVGGVPQAAHLQGRMDGEVLARWIRGGAGKLQHNSLRQLPAAPKFGPHRAAAASAAVVGVQPHLCPKPVYSIDVLTQADIPLG